MSAEVVNDLLAQCIRVGFVTGRDPSTLRVQVQCRDTVTEALITDWLPVLVPRAKEDCQYELPDVGDQVLCLFLPHGREEGFVLGCMYAADAPPVADGDKWHRKFKDGSSLEYDRKANKLTACIKGQGILDVECEGPISVTSTKRITLRAPDIQLEGDLSQQGYDGGPASSVLNGTYTVCNGSVHVPDGNTTVGGSVAVGEQLRVGMDVLARAVSLVRHIHDAVMPGGGVSGMPAGSGEGGSTDAPLTEDEKREQIFAMLDSIQDTTILCMPAIAEGESMRAQNPHDAQGWQYLHDFMEKWLRRPRYVMQPDDKENRIYDNGGQEPSEVPWSWLLRYQRVVETWNKLAEPEYLFMPDSWATLTKILRMEGAFEHDSYTFDHSRLPWTQWRPKAFQGLGNNKIVQGMNPDGKPDGLLASIGSFTIFALAAGNIRKQKKGSFRITVEKVFFFLFDGFEFNGAQFLGSWSCDEHAFTIPGVGLRNLLFRRFRDRTGYGCDFRVIAKPLELEPFAEVVYDTLQL